MAKSLRRVWTTLWQKKASTNAVETGGLPKCLSVVDIACLGLATTLGTGAYVLMPEAARDFAGPSVVISIILASVTSCLGSLCYSEVATRFPAGGSAYVYAYATTGEFFAFLIGWGMVLEYSLGTAIASKACTQYLDVTVNGTLFSTFQHVFGKLDLPALDRYIDVPSVFMVIFASSLMSFSVKCLCSINNVLVVVNLLVLSGILLIGTFNMDAENWIAGAGFFPNGASGVISGASLCYFCFIGYDIMAISSGETTHRIRIFPTAVTVVFLIGLLTLFGTSIAITLFIPTALLQSRGSLLEALILRGVVGIQYFAVVGAAAGFFSAAVASIYAHTRLLQNLAADGLLFRFLGKRQGQGSNCTATIAACTASSLLALVCDTNLLVHCVGMGTLLSSTTVAIAVLFLRYGVEESFPLEPQILSQESSNEQLSLGLEENDDIPQPTKKDMHNCLSRKNSSASLNCGNGLVTGEQPRANNYGTIPGRTLSVDYVNDSFVTCLTELSPHWSKRAPSQKSAATAAGLISSAMIIMLLMGVVTLHVPKLLPGNTFWTELLACGLLVIVIVCVVLVCRQPRHKPKYRNHVPCVPLLPLCAILMDVHLLVGLPYTSWLVFLVWTILGSLLYLAYGLWNSTLRKQEDPDVGLLSLNEEQDDHHDDEEGLVDNF